MRMSGLSRVIGSWKMSPRSGPAEATQLLVRHPDEVPAAVEHLPVRDGCLREQPEDPAPERRLPAARLADEAQDLPGADVERHSVDRPHGAAGRAVVHAQVAHRDDRLRGSLAAPRSAAVGPRSTFTSGRFRSTGLIVSFSPSPSSVSPVTRSTIARPGKSPVHQMPDAASETARWMS